MSLLVPDARDRVDAHGDLDQDEVYYEKIAKLQHELPWEFTLVGGFFRQSDAMTDDMTFNYVEEDFGCQADWATLVARLRELNDNSPENECYKLLFLARHGQGFHNIASAKYLKQAWTEKWRFLGSDGEIVWGPDPELTSRGHEQAAENRTFWLQQLGRGAPIPTKFYVSPLSRSINTLELTWKDQRGELPVPVVKENLRETIGLHLCHKRLLRSEIAAKFPWLEFEPGFTESDELFEAKYRNQKEQLWEQFLRANRFLQEVYDLGAKDENSVMSITCHAGMIRSFITVIGHRKFTIPTGGQIPVVVRGVRRMN